MNLRPYQNRALDAIDSAFSEVNSALIVMATGCHAKGEKVLLANGSTVSVESVKKGDTLLGADGLPRTVLALHHGVRDCYEIRPTKGSPFIVTDDHILSLERTTVRNDCFPCHKGGEIIDISVLDWISSSKTFQHQHKLYRSKLIEFPTPHEKLPIPSYILGVLLGDGGIKTSIDVTTAEPEVLSELKEYAAKNGYTLRYEPAGLAKRWIFLTHTQGCRGSALHNHLKGLGLRGHGSEGKFIPLCYKTASSHDRLELLAGLIDTDGSKSSNSSCDYTTKSRQLAEDIVFICRSLGLAAYHHQCVKNIKSINFSGLYWRVSISGDLSIIPTRVARRKFEQRKQKKSVLRTGFTATPIGKREYFGFTVDGDNRYLLDDFTVTHNCGKTIVMSALADREIRRGGRVLILAHRAELINQAVDKLERATGISAGIEMADLCSDTDAETPPYMVVVGSVQSMCRPARLARFHPDDFTLVMIDECHHALADTYRSVVSHFSGAKLLGVTATPDRGDLRSLGEVFEKIAFEYSIVEAIKDGYLSPVRAQTIPLKIDISGVAKQNGDYQASGLGSALAPYLHQICIEILQRAADRKTVVFTPLIATSRLMLDKFAELGAADRVREVNGESKDRKETLEWFDNAPKGSIILNSMLLTEGWDSPSADCICVLRATKSRGLYCLDTQTEVLTKDGWKSDVEIGENVLAFNHLTNETSFVPVISKIRRALNPDEFFCSIKGQSCDIRVTNHHRMIYDNKKRKGWKIKEAQEVASLKDGAYIPVSGHGNFVGVPLTDDEIRFIGWVMTDGTINKSNNAIYITQSDSHGDYCVEIENCIKGCGFKFGRHVYEYKDDHSFNANGKCICWTISKGIPRGRDKHLTGWARLERWIDKDLSTALFDMTEHQFSVMLEAIHHADGSKNGMPTYTIRKGNRTFIERLQMMAIQRGYRANVSVANIVGGKDLWSIFVKKCGYVKVGANLPRHRKWVKEDYAAEECWCVETKLGTIVTRRNGKVAIVGNCQMVGRGTRLCEGKENLLLLDFLWLTQSHDLCRPAVLLSNDDEVCEMITKKQEKVAGVEDIELTPETLEEAESDTVKKRHDALAKKLEEQRRKKGNLVDPLQYAYSISDINLTNYTPLTDRDSASPTMEQINRLEQLGFGCPDSFGAAELLVKTAEERHAKGMAAPKEIRLLERRHFKNVAQWTHEQASKMIRRLVANGWRIPHGIKPETYIP